MLKIYQKTFGGRAPPGPAGELKGIEGREGEGRGKGEPQSQFLAKPLWGGI